MPKLSKKITIIMYVELVALLALMGALNCRSNAQFAERQARLAADSAERLLQEVDEAKLLITTCLAGHVPLIKEGCKDLGRTISGELACPFWKAETELAAGDQASQLNKSRQLAEPVIAALVEPDKISQKAPGSTELIAHVDALRQELLIIGQSQFALCQDNRRTDLRLTLAQSILQIIVIVLYVLLVWSIRKEQKGNL
jgi:hypothetical protein